MRLVFAGTPEPAVPALRTLVDAHRAGEHEIVAVITRPDAPLGRRRVLTPSPVARAAAELIPDVPVLRVARLDAAATAAITALQPELGVIVAYGGLVREPLLGAPEHGWINLHFSLLPRWRGAAPVQHAVIAGDAETGTAVFRLVPELDAGDVYAVQPSPLDPTVTAGELLVRLAESGAVQLRNVVDEIAAGTAIATPQAGVPSHAAKLTAADGSVRWGEPAHRVLARINGTTPEPGAHTVIDGARLKILAARATGSALPTGTPALPPGEMRLLDGAVLVGTATAPIELVRLQPAGKTPTDAVAWWRGIRVDRLQADVIVDAATPAADEGAAR